MVSGCGFNLCFLMAGNVKPLFVFILTIFLSSSMKGPFISVSSIFTCLLIIEL